MVRLISEICPMCFTAMVDLFQFHFPMCQRSYGQQIHMSIVKPVDTLGIVVTNTTTQNEGFGGTVLVKKHTESLRYTASVCSIGHNHCMM